jgi:hypothetical protein
MVLMESIPWHGPKDQSLHSFWKVVRQSTGESFDKIHVRVGIRRSRNGGGMNEDGD